jgi:putative FmdB family regulatory protein
MPIYVYLCSSCAARSEIRHGIEDGPPDACPACGATGTLRKSFAAPAIVFKGSGWAKKERRVAPSSSGSSESKDGEAKAAAGTDGAAADPGSRGEKAGDAKTDKPAATGDKAGEPKAAHPSSTGGSAPRSSGSDAD